MKTEYIFRFLGIIVCFLLSVYVLNEIVHFEYYYHEFLWNPYVHPRWFFYFGLLIGILLLLIPLLILIKSLHWTWGVLLACNLYLLYGGNEEFAIYGYPDADKTWALLLMVYSISILILLILGTRKFKMTSVIDLYRMISQNILLENKEPKGFILSLMKVSSGFIIICLLLLAILAGFFFILDL